MKKCSNCKKYKAFSDFAIGRCYLDGYQYTCKKCQQKYKQQRSDRVKYIRRQYYLDNKEKIKNTSANYRKENVLKVKESNRRSRKKHLSKKLARNAQHRGDQLNATPTWLSKEQKDLIITIYANKPKGYHVDHIIPLKHKSVSGLHVPWNLQYLTAHENTKKGNRITLEELNQYKRGDKNVSILEFKT